MLLDKICLILNPPNQILLFLLDLVKKVIQVYAFGLYFVNNLHIFLLGGFQKLVVYYFNIHSLIQELITSNIFSNNK